MIPDAAYAALYFGVQAARSGVAPGHIRRAAWLLDGDLAALDTHVGTRLTVTHGADADWRAWLARQPLADRAASEARQPPMHGRETRRLELRRTSGSTGAPFRFVRDREMTTWMDAVMWASYAWHGIRPGQRHARFWGRPIDAGSARRQRVRDSLLARRRLGAIDLTPGSAVEYFRSLLRFRPAYAYGYPSLMSRFADHCESAGLSALDLGIDVVVATGELLTDRTRARLASFFGARVVNEYGCTESGILALECEEAVLHATPIAAYPEVVDPSGAPSDAGEVVVTDLYGRTGTLLRHRLHDAGSWSTAGSCACGRALPRLRVDEGRLASFVRLPNGDSVHSSFLAYSVPATVARFRCRQVSADRLVAEIVPLAGADPGRAMEDCRRAWADRLGSSMELDVIVVSDIPPTAGGKLRYFVPFEEPEQTR